MAYEHRADARLAALDAHLNFGQSGGFDAVMGWHHGHYPVRGCETDRREEPALPRMWGGRFVGNAHSSRTINPWNLNGIGASRRHVASIHESRDC